jgi:hypothetical protein
MSEYDQYNDNHVHQANHALLEELLDYLLRLYPAVPTALAYARKIEAHLADPLQCIAAHRAEAQRQIDEQLQRDAATRHGVVANPAGCPILAVEVEGDEARVFLPHLNDDDMRRFPSRDARAFKRLQGGVETFQLRPGNVEASGLAKPPSGGTSSDADPA